jgi:pyrroline-5-carboxylate reductase
MQIGLIGSGNMARGLARGWGRPVLCTDVVPERARALAEESGGRVVASNAELARRADVVVLCHKPAQLGAVASEVAPEAKAVASILGGVTLARLQEAYPERPVYRFLPSTPVEVRKGVVIQAKAPEQDPGLDARVADLFGELGLLVPLEESLVNVAMGLMSNAPAYVALVVEAQVDAGIRHGLPAELASDLVLQTLAGTAELIRRRGGDTLAVRREVTSPGGSTARGLDALERGGVRAAFSDALDAILQQREWKP